MSKRRIAQLKANLLRKQNRRSEDEDGGDSGTGELKPGSIAGASLPEGTKAMEAARRELEQSGHRKVAKVNARYKTEREFGNDLQQGDQYQRHPFLDSQRFDGIAADLNPDLNNNPDARWAYENERAEQEKEKQLRMEKQLENQNRKTHSSTPSPKPM